jgi:hypothetical protein
MLTQEYLKSILSYDPETGVFVRKIKTTNSVKIGDMAGYITPYGYISISINRKRQQAHRLAWFYIYGEFPKYDIDHINGIRHDNRIENLRLATRSENMQNLKKAKSDNKSTGLLGTFLDKRDGRIYARIKINKNLIHLGCFETKEEAHEAYLTAKRECHEFGTL